MGATPDELHLARLNQLEYFRCLARWSGRRGEVEERDGMLRWATASDFFVTCNGTVRLDRSVDPTAVIEAADAFFGARARGWALNVEDPTGADADLVAAAGDAGMVELHGAPTMVCRVPPTLEAVDGIELRWLAEDGDPDDFVAVADVAYQSLGMAAGAIEDMNVGRDALCGPEVDVVVAHDTGTGEALACAMVVPSHGIAGLYYVATLPAARGRGLARLVTAAVTRRGFERGAAFVCLQATDMGHPVYLRLGYEDVTRTHTFVRLPPR